MSALLLTPGGLLVALLLIVGLLYSLRGRQPATPMIVYVPVEAPVEPRGSGCLPLLVFVGLVLVILLGSL